MNDITSPLQSTSYTNKDFVSIYEELLDLTKEISSKWDPSISNESDPGVILLKLNAIIADKCNYSIDKSLLECFPLSVTQQNNARQLFEQLGYYMHWYKSATTIVTVRWIGDKTDYSISIPEFTMVTDDNNNIVYSLLGPSVGSTDSIFNIGSQTLVCSGNSFLSFRAIQGVSVKYSINNDTTITVANLDSNNRIYFDTTNVAENGIFINNVGINNYSSWVKKDNLLVEELGNTFYKFGVSRDGNSCYIEFPQDAAILFQNGINITYIRTDGSYGNVAADYLSKFYNDLTLPALEDSTQLIKLDSEAIELRNDFAAVNGLEEESINDAYRGYKSTVGTFDTLVTLRDYINYINRSGLVSNCFVCDRQNDIQTTYKIMASVNDVDQMVTNIEEDQDIDAFSLKLYLLQYVEAVTDVFSYNNTFYLLNNNDELPVKRYTDATKSVQHDYIDLVSPTPTSSHICFFKNKFPVECTIIPQTTLTVNQLDEVKNNIRLALYRELNAKKLSFGEDISYNFLYDIIKKSDNRIKNISLSNVEYKTYAVYYVDNEVLTYDGTNWMDSAWNIVNPNFYNLYPSNPIPGATLLVPPYSTEIDLNGDDIYYCSNLKDADGNDVLYYVPVAKREELGDNGKIDFNVATFYSEFGLEHCYEEHLFEFEYDDDDEEWICTCDGEGTITLEDLASVYGVIIPNESLSLLQDGLKIKVKLSYAHQFRKDVYAKSVLAGKTQFFVKDEEFDYKLRDKYQSRIDKIEKVYTNVNIPFTVDSSSTSWSSEYELRENECLQFYSPNLIDSDSYSNYVIFEYSIASDILPDTDYQLKSDEYIIFYWREDAADISTVYKYRAYGAGTIIHPSFAITARTDNGTTSIAKSNYLIQYSEFPDETRTTLDSSSVENGDMTLSCAQKIQAFSVTAEARLNNILSSIKTISIKKINEIYIDKNSQYSLYWILNEKTNNKYVLFSEDESSRLLNTGEYFFYTNAAHTTYVVLGSGTRITRGGPVLDQKWEVPVLDDESLLINGMLSVLDKFFVLPDSATVSAVENKFMNIGPGCTVKLIPIENNAQDLFTIDVSTSGTTTISDITFNTTQWATKVPLDNPFYTNIYEFIYSSSGSIWKLNNVTVDLSDYGITIDSGATISNNDKIIVVESCFYTVLFNNNSCSITLPSDETPPAGHAVYKRTIADPTLANFSIEYHTPDTLSSDNAWNSLSDLVLSDNTGWNGRSLLSIKISPTKSQILLANQSLFYKTKESDSYSPINGADIVPEDLEHNTPAYYPCCIMSSFSLYTDGGEIFNTYLYNEDGSLDYLSLYQFSKQENLPMSTSTAPYEIVFSDDGSINFIFTPSVSTRSLSIRLPVGDYILPIKNYNSGLETLYVTYNYSPINLMYDSDSLNLKDEGTYYLDLHVIDDTDEYPLTITMSGQTVDSIIQIGNCFKYGKPSLMSQSSYEMIREWINYLDTNHVFKYDISVPETTEISNPTDPATFLDVDHIYNNFTICQFTNLYAK